MKATNSFKDTAWFRTARWLLVLPSAILGFYVAGNLTILLDDKVAAHLCPAGKMISFECTVEWINWLPALFGSVVGPTLIIICGTQMAPSHRPIVAWLLYSGFLLSAAIFVHPEYQAFLVAALAGGIIAGAIHWKNAARQYTERRITSGSAGALSGR